MPGCWPRQRSYEEAPPGPFWAARQSEEFLEDSFDGSLPAFLAAFAARKKLTQEEIDRLQELIDQSRE